MRRYRTLAPLVVGLLVSGAAHVAGAAPVLRAEAAAVTAVRVIPGAGRADVVLSFSGDVQVSDFILATPHRIVVDLRGATMQLRAPVYDQVPRAGIRNVRLGQFQRDVVRLVLDLDAAREYSVVRGDGEIRVSVMGPDAFAPWSAGAAEVAALPVPADEAPEITSAISALAPSPRAGMREFARQQSSEPRADVSFMATPIAEVISFFSSISGRTFIVGSSVAGTVTAEIPGQPWDVALSKILQSQGLSAVEDSTGIITIDSYKNLSARVAAEPLVTQIVSVNYAKASEMANTIRQIIAACSSGSAGAVGGGGADTGAGGAAAGAPPGGAAPAAQNCGRGTVAVEEKTNTLLITESVSRLPEIVGYVRDLDVPTPQVAIRAKIISVDRTATEELGISYDFGTTTTFNQKLISRGPVGEFQVNLRGMEFAGVANADRAYGQSAALNLIYNTARNGMNLTSFLDALSAEELTDVQAEPSTTTIDNRKATLFAGTEVAFLLTPPIPAGQVSSVAPQISNKRVGITLEVTPHVTANRRISMEISARQQALLQVTEAGPTISERASTNEVLVGDGETAVIGGLTQTQVSKIRTGIPILMRLPILGRLFSQTRTVERKQDLLILVTPHIVDEGEVVRNSRP